MHGIDAITGARENLLKLKEHFELHVVTARPHNVREQTISWVKEHYDGIFCDFHFGNLYGMTGERKKKSQICKEIGAVGLVDDSAGYAMDCAVNGIKVVLFGNYAWNNATVEHDLIARADSWETAREAIMTKFLV